MKPNSRKRSQFVMDVNELHSLLYNSLSCSAHPERKRELSKIEVKRI